MDWRDFIKGTFFVTLNLFQGLTFNEILKRVQHDFLINKLVKNHCLTGLWLFAEFQKHFRPLNFPYQGLG